MLTQGIVCTTIVVSFNLLAMAAKVFHDRLVANEEKESFDNTKKATTATVLKPLSAMLPILGWLVALQRLVTGLETVCHVCHSHPVRFKAAAQITDTLRHLVEFLLPLKCHLANAIGLVLIISLTWTLQLLKRRWFNSFLAKLDVSGIGSEEADAAANIRRALLPANSLASWIIVGAAVVVGLRVVGLDPSPLLTLGSVSGIVVGFASQALLLNLVSGVSIFITRPFIVGDAVSVRSGAAIIAQGTIANISPLRTTFLDESSQTVTLPNKMLSDMIITNIDQDPKRVKRARTKASQKIKHVMNYEFTLKRPPNYRPMQSYDEHARSVIKSLLVRLSILPNVVKNTATAYVSSLTAAGEIVVKVSALGVATESNPPESNRQIFLLAIHKALCTAEGEVAKSAGA
eukprot:jgi/Ulvmu1/4903/UM020_0189.1